MIIEWMMYAALMSILVGGVALAVEQGARLLRWPTRWIWAGAMLLSLAIPPILLLRPAGISSPMATPGGSDPIPMILDVAASTTESPAPVALAAALGPRRSEPLDAMLLLLWGLGSLALTLMLLRSAHRLAWERQGWGARDHFRRPGATLPESGTCGCGTASAADCATAAGARLG